MPYEFGGLIVGGAYFQNFTVYKRGMLFSLLKTSDDRVSAKPGGTEKTGIVFDSYSRRLHITRQSA